MADDTVTAAALSEVAVLLRMQVKELEQLVITSSFEEGFKVILRNDIRRLKHSSNSFTELAGQFGAKWPQLSPDQLVTQTSRLVFYLDPNRTDVERLEYFLRDRQRVKPLIDQIDCGHNAYAPSVMYPAALVDGMLFVSLKEKLAEISGQGGAPRAPKPKKPAHKISK